MTQAQPVVGIIGAGNVLPAYLRTLTDLAARGMAVPGPVVTRRPERRAELRQRWPSLMAVPDIDALLTTRPDIVVVLTPPSERAEHLRHALEAGAHVLVEKPSARSTEEAAPIYELASKLGQWLVGAPFTHCSPTLRELVTRLDNGEIGDVHSARAMYGNQGAPWASWHLGGEIGPTAEVGSYSLRTLTALLGPIASVIAASTGSGVVPHTVHAVLEHCSGAQSSVLASHGIAGYRRPAVELYATDGTANLLGDDWDPTGLAILPRGAHEWRMSASADPNWHWTDGLVDLVHAVRDGRPPAGSAQWDLHLLDSIAAIERAAVEDRRITLSSSFAPLDLRIDFESVVRTTHDHSRPAEDQ